MKMMFPRPGGLEQKTGGGPLNMVMYLAEEHCKNGEGIGRSMENICKCLTIALGAVVRT